MAGAGGTQSSSRSPQGTAAPAVAATTDPDADGVAEQEHWNDLEGDATSLAALVRSEASLLAGLVDAVAGEVEQDMPEVDLELRLYAVNKALAQIRQRDAGLRGRLGERSARITQAKVRIPAASGKAAFRIPDELNERELIEIKNVARVRWTHQLSDFLVYAQQTDRRFILKTRPDARIARRLQEHIDAGRITRVDIGGFTSLAMRAVIRRAIEESLGRRSEALEPTAAERPSGA